jgi:hypothetical protein
VIKPITPKDEIWTRVVNQSDHSLERQRRLQEIRFPKRYISVFAAVTSNIVFPKLKIQYPGRRAFSFNASDHLLPLSSLQIRFAKHFEIATSGLLIPKVSPPL